MFLFNSDLRVCIFRIKYLDSQLSNHYLSSSTDFISAPLKQVLVNITT